MSTARAFRRLRAQAQDEIARLEADNARLRRAQERPAEQPPELLDDSITVSRQRDRRRAVERALRLRERTWN